MKRTGLIAVLGLSLVALVSPAVSAHGDPGGRGGHHGDHSSLRAFASNAEVGGTMVISAAVGGHHRAIARFGHRHADCDIVVSAVVNFRSAPFEVPLPAVQSGERVSRHFFQGSVGVGNEEQPGDITVDVTAACGDRSATVTVPATITETASPPPIRGVSDLSLD